VREGGERERRGEGIEHVFSTSGVFGAACAPLQCGADECQCASCPQSLTLFIIFLISKYSFELPPSTRYVASVYGQPTNPSTAVSVPAVSSLSVLSAVSTNGHVLNGSMRCMAFTASQVSTFLSTGPFCSWMSNSSPIPGRGVRMSEKRMHPSVL